MSSKVPRKLNLCLWVFINHYRQAPLQAGAIIVGIILAVTLLTGVRAINENAKRSYSATTEQLSQQADWFVTPSVGQSTLDESVYFDLRAAGFSQSLAVIEGTLTSDDGNRWQIQGSDLVAALSAASLNNNSDYQQANKPSLTNNQLPLAEMLAGKPVVLMSEELTKRLSGRESMTLSGLEVKVVSLNDDFNLSRHILMDISLAQKLLNRANRLSYIALFDQSKLKQQSISNLLAGRAVLSQNDKGESLTALTDSFHLNLTAMSMLAFIVGLFIAYNGVRYSLLKRHRIFTQLQQLGMGKVPLLLALFVELLLLVIIGSVVGFVLGLQLGHWLHPMVSVTLEQLYDATMLPGIWRWNWLFQAIVLTFVSSLLACSSLFIQLMREPLARTAGLYYQQKSANQVHKVQLIISTMCAGTAGALLPFSHDYKQTMFLLGLVVLAIPLALPWCLTVLVRLISKFTPKGLLGYQVAETKELVAPLSLAMMAMLLAVTANISMNTLVGSFESTLNQWLNARLHADLYVRPAQSQMIKVEHFLQQQTLVTSVYKQFYQKSQHGTLPIYLVTKDKQTLKQTTLFKGAASDIWPQFFAGNMVIISEPMAIRLGFTLGDSITLAAIPNKSFIVGGIFYDYGNPYGEVFVSPEIWRQQRFSVTPLSLGVSYQGKPMHLRRMLKQKFGLSDTLIYDQAQIKQRAITIFNKTFAITKVLNSLTLLVAAIGLFSACFMLTEARAAPIARLYSLGVSRKQITIMVITQMLSIVLLTCLVALPAGAVLGYLLINYITLQAFGWSIAMLWDWLVYVDVVVLALVSSLLAVALPLYRQTKRPLISSLQREVI